MRYLIPIVVIAVVAILSSIFIVDEREKALVLRFGQIKQEIQEPGLNFKLPLLDEVVRYEDRILSLDTPSMEVTPADDRRLVVDTYVMWRIDNIRQFREALAVAGIREAEIQLNSILDGQIRAVLGSEGVTSNTILSEERTILMDRIEERVDERAQALGINVVDVRLRQTNLPEQNFEATLQRMIAEREREATDERARGREAAQRVRAQADRTYTEILSEAERDARIIEGEADAERNSIFAEAYGQDMEFFEFYRSLSAYEQSLQGRNSTMVMSPDSEFFNYLRSDQGAAATERDAVAPDQPGADADQPGAAADEGTDAGDQATDAGVQGADAAGDQTIDAADQETEAAVVEAEADDQGAAAEE